MTDINSEVEYSNCIYLGVLKYLKTYGKYVMADYDGLIGIIAFDGKYFCKFCRFDTVLSDVTLHKKSDLKLWLKEWWPRMSNYALPPVAQQDRA